jgi:predicted GNAT family N-acyltransferase
MLIEQARHRGLLEVTMNAQVQVVPFYEKRGFRAEGPVFDEAGIPHRRMRKALR